MKDPMKRTTNTWYNMDTDKFEWYFGFPGYIPMQMGEAQVEPMIESFIAQDVDNMEYNTTASQAHISGSILEEAKDGGPCRTVLDSDGQQRK